MNRLPALALITAIALGACSSTISTTPRPQPTTTPAILSIETQRVEAQAGIAVAQGIQLASLLTAVLEQLPLGGGTLPTGACKNGVETTIKVLNPEQLQVTIDAFYDAACKTRFAHASLKTTFFPSGNLTIDGTSTAYNTRGRAVGYAAFTTTGIVSSTGAHAVTTGTLSQKRNAPAQLAFGLTCTLSSKNDCGFGAVIASIPSAAQSLGVAAILDGFTGNGAASGTASLNAYAAAPGKLKLKQGSGDSWVVRGGKLVASPAGTFDETVNQKSLNAVGNIDLKDTAANASVALNFETRTGISKGEVRSITPATLYSSFGTDATGTGAIAYSSGPGGRIISSLSFRAKHFRRNADVSHELPREIAQIVEPDRLARGSHARIRFAEQALCRADAPLDDPSRYRQPRRAPECVPQIACRIPKRLGNVRQADLRAITLFEILDDTLRQGSLPAFRGELVRLRPKTTVRHPASTRFLFTMLERAS